MARPFFGREKEESTTMKKVFLVVVLCLLAAMSAFGQTDRGTITGTVSDASGAVIPGASVTAKNTETGLVYNAGSSETGNYTLPQLPAGRYEVTVELPGFKKFVSPGVTLNATQVARIDAKLEVGQNTDSVTVEAAAPLLKTESGEISHNVQSDTLINLPILTIGAGGAGVRNPLASITLMPGTSFSNDFNLRVNGMPSNSQTIRIEGQDATNGLWRAQNQINQPSVDAMQEVTVQTSSFDAEYGQGGGGLFNYTMKSGGNDFHGAVYDYFVNEAFNAGTPFTDRANFGDPARAGQHVRNRQRRNDWGFNIGGPVMLGKWYDGHNKTFFFFNLDQFRETRGVANGLTTVPTTAMRNGDFSAIIPTTPTLGCTGCAIGQLSMPNPQPGNPGYNPAVGPNVPVGAVDPLGRPVFQNQLYDYRTAQTASDGSTIRNPFQNNQIDPGLFDPISVKILNMIPTPTTSALTNNYVIPGYYVPNHTTIPSFKIDHNFDAKDKISFYFNYNRERSPGYNGFTQPWSTAAPTLNDSYTYRINYDRTLSPTQVLHLGIGYLSTYQAASIPTSKFDQSTLGWTSSFYVNQFPNILGIGSASFGGSLLSLGPGFAAQNFDRKPTANVTYTWVKGNHSIKMGADLIVEGIQTINDSRANGQLGFGTTQSGIGNWESGRGLNSTTGFGFASFLLGHTNGITLSQVTDARLGRHMEAFYAQDSWKVTRKLTLNYGLRYDYATLYREQYGRMQNANFNEINPLLNRLGNVDYEGSCHCQFNKNYPWAFGPRLSVAYQIAPNTVLRAGSALAYGTSADNAYLSYSVPDFYQPAAAYGDTFSQLSDGNIFGPGNKFGNAPIVWPDFSPHYPFEVSPGNRPPQSPFIFIDRHAGRPPRILQWSLNLQRELSRNLLVEAAYVGNRGVWWSAPLLQTQAYNGLTVDNLTALGIDLTKQADRTLLTTPISQPSVIARFPNLANRNSVYPGFPASQPLIQALRPYPQWGSVSPFLGPPLGDTWYDSLQLKVTQRFSRGLTASAAYTYAKELVNGSNGDTSYLTVTPPGINDVFNRAQNKQLSNLGHPNALVLNFNYTTPKVGGDSLGLKLLSGAVHDWTFSGVLRYQSGNLIKVPSSNNSLFTYLGRTGGNLAPFATATYWNRVPGQPLLLKDPNCHCINPTDPNGLVLNSKAWTDAPFGQFSYSAPYYNDYRWQRQPSEALSVGRDFHLSKDERGVKLNVRAEFQNVFNRLVLSAPSSTNPASITSCSAQPGGSCSNPGSLVTSGFGFVNYVNGAGAVPRTGQIVARLIF